MTIDNPQQHGRRATDQTITLPIDEYKQLLKENFTDPLTGLGNRRYWENNLLLLRNSGKPFVIFVIDVTDFKKYNDTHGHLVGDQTLRDIADMLRRDARETDILARTGGDELALAFEVTDEEHTHPDKVAQRILDNLLDYNNNQIRPELKVKLSIGYATSLETSDRDTDEIFRIADKRMYDNKTDSKEHKLTDGAGI